MRINIILGPFLPGLPGPAGAVEKVWQGVGERLAQAGHCITIVEKSGVARGSDKGGITYRQVRGFERPASILQALMLDFIYSHRALAVLPPADLTVSNTFFLPTVLMQLQRGHKKRKLGLLVPNIQRMPKGQIRFFSELKAITTVSEAAKCAIIAEFGAAKLADIIQVVPNPVDTSIFNVEGRPPLTARRILYAGRIAPEKGVKELVSAFAALRSKGHLQNFELTVIGPHEVQLGGGGQPYLKVCKDHGQGHPVRFLPSIKEPKLLADEMRQAEFFAYPSLAEKGETFGVSALEAMACGAVAIVSDLACFKDFIRDGKNGFVYDHRGDAQAALQTALLKVSQIKDIATIRTSAVKTSKRFSYEAVTADYEKIFVELVQSATLNK